MYIIKDEDRYYINRVYWFHSGDCAIYEFTNKDGDVIDYEVGIRETINEIVELYFD
ncbi:MAG: hypothetical protein IKA31_04505 [Clostridia bacterium]|nr:hypothetical protein [Clostridia bacterium]